MWNNAQFQTDLTQLGFARADLAEAGIIRNPLFTVLLPLGPKQLELTALIPIEALWQRPHRVAAAKVEVERVASNLVQTGLDLVRNVKVAWAEAVLARHRIELARKSSDLRTRIASIADARLTAGDISQLELLTVRVEKRRAEHDVRRLELEAVAANERLGTLLGLITPAGLKLSELGEPARDADDLDAELRESLGLRPDLRAAELSIEATHARASAALAATFPQTNLVADANGAGLQGFEIGPGLQLELPLFNQNQGQRARADADYERAIWAYVAARQRVLLEVRQAHGRHAVAKQQLELLRAEVLSELGAAVSRAEKAFGGGEVSLLFVLDITRQQLDAWLREAELVAELRRAGAELDRSIGRKRLHAN
ncbi:MAG: TolC family protein [Myxococcaceae bacterium]|nr:TolC family protein [Myxococcaceae bacterium]